MTQEDKQLLLKDICARLLYGVILKTPQGDGYLNEVSLSIFGHKLGINIKAAERTYFKLEECKPYLRLMSSMTEEEFVYFMNLKGKMLQSYEIKNIMKKVLNTTQSCGIVTQLDKYSNKIDWLNANQFDYRGLIPKGLAIKVTKENNSYKK